MFEALLEKLIINHFGKYIAGLDRNNLHLGIIIIKSKGVWSGNIVIENVNLKPEILEMLDLPGKLKFSCIGKLKISVPWSKLSSYPVEVLLEKVLIVISPLQKNEWKFQDFNACQRKIEMIQAFASESVDKFLKKTKKSSDKEKSEGYFDKLTIKVIDNLQLTVKDIHFRYEDENYAWGITLDEILILTTDDKWNPKFLDRTNEKNQMITMNKLLRLKSLGLYWNYEDKSVISANRETTMQKLINSILRNERGPTAGEFIIAITAEAKLIQRSKMDHSGPVYSLFVELGTIDVQIREEQLIQMTKMLNDWIAYQKMLTIERRKIRIRQEKEEIVNKEAISEEFIKLFKKIESSEDKNLSNLTESENEAFKEIILTTPTEELFQWTKIAVKDMQKQLRIQELEKIKKKRSGWWGRGITDISEEEISQVESFIEENFSDESIEKKAIVRSDTIPWFVLDVKMKGGSLYLSGIEQIINKKEEKEFDRSGLKFRTAGLHLCLNNYNVTQEFIFRLQDLNMLMITEYANRSSIITPLIYRNNRDINKNDKEIIYFLYEKNPKDRNEDVAITLQFGSVETVYIPQAITRFQSFFKIEPSQSEDFKTAAWNKIEKLQDSTMSSISDLLANTLKLKVDLKFNAPTIIIPFVHNNDQSAECWLLNLGDIFVKSKIIEEKEISLYDEFLCGLNSMRLQYFPCRMFIDKFCLYEKGQTKELSEHEKKLFQHVFKVIDDINLEVDLRKLKSSQFLSKDNPMLKFDVILPQLSLNLTPKICKHLADTPNILFPHNSESFELLQTEKLQLLKSEIISGKMLRQGNTYKTWSAYYVIFSGGYLYFFTQQKDLAPVLYTYIKNSSLEKIDNFDGLFALKIKNRYEEVLLGFPNEIEREDWFKALNEKLQDYSFFDQNKIEFKKKEKKKIIQQKINLIDNILFIGKIFVENFTIKGIENEKMWICIQSKNFNFALVNKSLDFICNLSLEKLSVNDWVFKYNNPEFIPLMESEGGRLFELELWGIEPDHPKFKNENLRLTLKCGRIIFNWKPDTLLNIFYNFVKENIEFVDNPFNLTSDDIQINRKTLAGERIILFGTFIVEEIKMNFLHKQTHVCLATALLKNAEINLTLQNLASIIEANVFSFQLLDMTNYPNTLDSNLNYESLEIHELVGPKEKILIKHNTPIKEKKEMITIYLCIFDDFNPNIKEGITTILDLEFKPIRINFYNQTTMRVIDYVLIQIISLISQPEYLSLNEGFYANIENFAPKKVAGELEFIKKALENPTFLNMNIKLNSVEIALKPVPTSKSYILAKCELICLTNRHIEKPSRLISGIIDESVKIWADEIKLVLKGLTFHVLQEKKDLNELTQVSYESSAQLFIERTIMADELTTYYGDKIKIDCTYKIFGGASPIVLQLYRSEYLLVLEMFLKNISFDDLRGKNFCNYIR